MSPKEEVPLFWYIVICALMLYPLNIVRAGAFSEKKTRHVALVAACLILWFFMAMRGISVGVDTKYYSYVFTQFSDIPLNKIFTAVTYATASETWAFDFEPGYRLLNKVVSWFCAAPQAITFVNSTLIMVLLYHLIQRNSPNYMLSIWLYITLGVYQTEMNVTRNAIAILMVYNGFTFAENRQFGKYLLVCLFASTFHAAALVFIPMYWLFHNFPLDLKKCGILIGASCLVGLIFPFISPYIRMVVPDNLDKYFEGNNEKLESLMVGLLNAGVFAVSYLMLRRTERRNVFQNHAIGTMMLLTNLCFFGLNLGLADASRMAALFGPYLIILIPRMLSRIRSDAARKKAAILVAVFCGIQYILRLGINNIGGSMPYVFFWQGS